MVNSALQHTGVTAQAIASLASAGVDLSHTGTLFAATFLLSNVVSNVPAVMLLLPVTPAEGGGVADLHSTAPGVGRNGIAYRQW